MYLINSNSGYSIKFIAGVSGKLLALMALWLISISGSLFMGVQTANAQAACTVSGTNAVVIVEDIGGGMLKCSTVAALSGAGGKFTIAAVGAVADLGLRDAGSTAYVADLLTCVVTGPGSTNFYTPGNNTCKASGLDDNNSVVKFTATSLTAFGILQFTHLSGTGANSVGTITTTTGASAPVTATSTSNTDNLDNQQKALSGLSINGQMNNLATGVSDYLDGRLDDSDNGLQVTANGFSASTTGFANILNRYQAKQNNPLAGLNGDASTSGYTSPAWNAWIKGNWNIYDGDNFDGHTVDVMAGVDYDYSDTAIIGMLGGYGTSDFDVVTSGTAGSFNGDSYSIGPYIGLKLSEHLRFKALAAYTYSDYTNVSGTTDGNFNAHRATVSAELTGTWNYDAFFVRPGIRFVYAQENQDSYTDSAGITHSSLVIRAGRISIGPKIGYTHSFETGGSFRPWLALSGEYDFSNQGSDAGSGLPDLSDVLSARFKAGFAATTTTGISLSMQGNVSGIGSDQFTGYGGTARLSVPF